MQVPAAGESAGTWSRGSAPQGLPAALTFCSARSPAPASELHSRTAM